MVATARARRLGLRGDVILAAVVDEEVGSIGTERLLESSRADAAIVAEPTEVRVCVAHKGFLGFEIEVRGRAAHGSRPDLGIDAIARMGHVLVRLEALDADLRSGSGHRLLGTGSLHASLIALVHQKLIALVPTPAYGDVQSILDTGVPTIGTLRGRAAAWLS